MRVSNKKSQNYIRLLFKFSLRLHRILLGDDINIAAMRLQHERHNVELEADELRAPRIQCKYDMSERSPWRFSDIYTNHHIT